jgi:N-glycosylase/DNA lyase
MTTSISIDQPLDLARTLESGQAFRWRRASPSVGEFGSQEWWHGFLQDEPVLLAQRSPGDAQLLIQCRRGAEEHVAAALRRYLRLDDDLPAVCRRFAGDEHLAGAVERLKGVRLLRQEPWECLVGFICSGQNNVLRISLMMERMADAFGRATRLHGVARKTFPSPERLAEAGEATLRKLGLGFRAGPVARAARLVADGDFPLVALCEWPYQRAKDALMGLDGVGPKIANCVLLFSLDKLEAFPVDRWVRRAVEQWYGLKPRLGRDGRPLKEALDADVVAWAQARWGRDAGYANQYLFLGRRAEEREVGRMTLVRSTTL